MIEVQGAAASAPDRAWLAERLTAAVALLGRRGGAIAAVRVRVVDDEEMSRLHERFLGESTTTDVLSWASPAGSRAGARGLGAESEQTGRGVEHARVELDIAVCADEAMRRAQEHGHALREELLLYAVHGLLHGVGFDDASAEAFMEMHEQEARLMRALGSRVRVETDGDGGHP